MRRRKTLLVQAPQFFNTIVIDPPWPERGGTAKSKAYGPGKRGADKHYDLLNLHEIPEVILNSGVFRPAADAHLYMWTTTTFLMRTEWVMNRLGFRYVACVPWIKTDARAGLGQYFRTKAEYLCFGVRHGCEGYAVRTEDKYVVGLIEAPRGAHSVKPEAAYDLIQRRSYGPYLEMFSRATVPRNEKWTHWGMENKA